MVLCNTFYLEQQDMLLVVFWRGAQPLQLVLFSKPCVVRVVIAAGCAVL